MMKRFWAHLALFCGCTISAVWTNAAQAQFFGPAPGLGGIFFGGSPRGVPIGPQPVAQEWHPARQNAYMQKVCRSARNGIDKDECQHTAESLISNLNDCIRSGSPYARTCSRMLPGARAQLARVNRDSTLLEHRGAQREGQRAGSIRSLCASQNGGYYVGSYIPCVRSYGIAP